VNAGERARLKRGATAEQLLAEDEARQERRRAKSAPRRQAAARAGRATKKSERAVYKAVRARDRICTAQLPATVIGPHGGRLEVDHQWGRGKEPTLVENCRLLCEAHHFRKTRSVPDRATHLEDYRLHSLKLGHDAEAARAVAQIALEKAQHPEDHHG
jgi:5-methylcytosine-specific restriction endonuclease McrA